jgi:hypothetical protein
VFGLPLDQRPSELFQAGIALPALAIGCRGGAGLVRRITLCLLIDGVTHQAEFDLRDVYSPKVVDEIAQGSVNRPIPEITATTTEASGLLQVRNLADTVPITHFYSWTPPPG